jgi:cytidylate kinase
MAENPPVIAIDGPGGAGKGTVSQLVARSLGWHLLDSGSLYRITAFAAREKGVNLSDSQAVAQVAENLDVHFADGAEGVSVLLDNRDITDSIRTEKAGADASIVAADPQVRQALIARQKTFARLPGLVADGRDMGSVVFPDASLKIFLTASVAERARRRYKQLKDKGMDVSLPALSTEMEERDRRDTERSVAPLRATEDARILDSTHLNIQEVVEQIILWAREVYALENC